MGAMDVLNLTLGGLIGGGITVVAGFFFHRKATEAQRKEIEQLKQELYEATQKLNEVVDQRLRRAEVEHVCLAKQFDMTHELAKKLLDDGWGEPEAILALSPGGEMVAQWLSCRHLGSEKNPIPIHTIVVNVDKHKVGRVVVGRGTAKVHKSSFPDLDHLSPNAKVLLVTDVVRTGKALQAAYIYLLKLPLFRGDRQLANAALAFSQSSDIVPQYHIRETNTPLSFDWKDKPTPQDPPCGGLCP
jgi:hypoxanthine phosphoribosyltransferase